MHLPTHAGPRRRTRRALLAAALPAVLAAVALPAAAQAAQVSFNDPVLTYQAAAGEINRPQVSQSGGEFVVRDNTPGLSLRAGAGCRSVSAQELRCRRTADLLLPTSINVRLGDRDDHADIRVPGVPTTVHGEAGSDIYFGGAAPGVSRVDYRGGDGIDLASYAIATAGVRVQKDEGAFDGRTNDLDNIRRDVENLLGSPFDDSLVGFDNPAGTSESFDGAAGNDFLGGRGGRDIFPMRAAPEGSDTIVGGNGFDTADYTKRTASVRATLDHGNGDDDGEQGEADSLREIEEVGGGSGGDLLAAAPGSTTPVMLWGFPGDDTIVGSEGDDTIFGEGPGGGVGADTIVARGGDDDIFARDGVSDRIRCGAGQDFVSRDSVEFEVLDCESSSVGTLRLAPKALRAAADKPVHMRLSWRHPHSWRKLRKIELRLRDAITPVGAVTIRPRAERIAAGGAVKLVRKHTRLTHTGKTVTAHLAIRLDDSHAGHTLTADVEATDMRGRRQLEPDAANVRVLR